jgi:hypothetical protein
VVCSACEHENPAGNRFCGMCGTPLPHRPLSIPEAQGTSNLARGPLENAPPDRHGFAVVVEIPDVQQPYSDASSTDTPATETRPSDHSASQEVPDRPIGTFEQSPVLVEIPGEQSNHPRGLTLSGETVPEDRQPEFVQNFDHSPPDQAEDTPAMALGVSDVLDELATAPAEPPTPEEAPHFPWMEDVLQQLVELEAAESSERRDEHPRFLDLLGELSLPAVEPEPLTSPVVASSFSEVSEAPQTMAGSRCHNRSRRASG